MAGVLGKCKALAPIDLSRNNVGDEGAGSLARALWECMALAHLDLSQNSIGDEGAGAFASVLGECKALAHLALNANKISDEGEGSFALVLGGWRVFLLTCKYQTDSYTTRYVSARRTVAPCATSFAGKTLRSCLGLGLACRGSRAPQTETETETETATDTDTDRLTVGR
eukprot:3483532-Rhodomonas_salina.1